MLRGPRNNTGVAPDRGGRGGTWIHAPFFQWQVVEHRTCREVGRHRGRGVGANPGMLADTGNSRSARDGGRYRSARGTWAGFLPDLAHFPGSNDPKQSLPEEDSTIHGGELRVERSLD